MCEFKIKIADTVVAVSAMFESTKRFCAKYAVDSTLKEDLAVTVNEAAIEAERAIQTVDPQEQITEPTVTYLELLALYRIIAEQLLERGIMLFHGSAVAVDGEAYIFTAVSGTGKSTHTRLWREYFGDRAVMVNDDKPLISFKDGRAYVHGTPWNGKHNIDTNVSVPVKAICILERAKTNSIRPVSVSDAFPTVFVQTYRPRDKAKLIKTMPLIDRLSRAVPIYRLGCNMDIEAARVAYEGMNK